MMYRGLQHLWVILLAVTISVGSGAPLPSGCLNQTMADQTMADQTMADQTMADHAMPCHGGDTAAAQGAKPCCSGMACLHCPVQALGFVPLRALVSADPSYVVIEGAQSAFINHIAQVPFHPPKHLG